MFVSTEGNPLDVVVVEIAGRSGISEGASAHFSVIFCGPLAAWQNSTPTIKSRGMVFRAVNEIPPE